MPIEDPVFNAGVDAMTPFLVTVSLHTADPAGTGANEVTGGTYAKQSLTWGAAAAASAASTNTPQFEVPAGTTVTHVGFWDGTPGTPGNFTASAALDNPEQFTNDGQLTLESATLTLVDA